MFDIHWNCHQILRTDMVREQAKVSIGRDEGEDTLGFPALEANTRMEAHIIQ